MTGWFVGGIDLGNGVVQSNGGSIDAFTVMLSSEGERIWSSSLTSGGMAADLGSVVAATSDSVVEVVTSISELGECVLTVSKRAALEGATVWSKSLGRDGVNTVGRNAGVDADDNIILAGQFDSTISFGGPTLYSGGAESVFVARLSSDGSRVSSHGFPGNYPSTEVDVALDRTGRSVVAGTFGGTVDFGGSTLTSAGGQDIFVFTVAP